MIGHNFSSILFLLFLAHLAAIIVALSWVYSDAEKRGQSGCLMTLLVFFAGWIGFVIWLILRQNFPENGEYQYKYTPTPSQPPISVANPGKLFYQQLNEDYWLWKGRKISEVEFLNRKEAAIEELKGRRYAVNDFLGELIPFSESGVLTEKDIEKIKSYLTGQFERDQARAKLESYSLEDLEVTELLRLYREAPSAEVRDELIRRGLHQYL